MRTTYFRNSLHLPWQKIASLFLLGFAFPLAVLAQESRKVRLLNYDDKKIHYGFLLSATSTTLNIQHSTHFLGDPEFTDSTLAISPVRTPAFSAGIIINKNLPDDLWDFRFTPTISFYFHEIDFIYRESTNRVVLRNNSTVAEFPMMFKYASVRRKNHRIYLTGGLTAAVALDGNRNTELDRRELQLNRWNMEISYGAGISGYMQLFNFAPEIRFSHGVVNMLTPGQDNIFANNLSRVTTHRVSLIINFEG